MRAILCWLYLDVRTQAGYKLWWLLPHQTQSDRQLHTLHCNKFRLALPFHLLHLPAPQIHQCNYLSLYKYHNHMYNEQCFIQYFWHGGAHALKHGNIGVWGHPSQELWEGYNSLVVTRMYYKPV